MDSHFGPIAFCVIVHLPSTIDTTQDSFSRRVSHYSCCVCLLSFTDSPLHAHISILRGLYPTMLLWCYRFYLLYGPYRTQRHCMFLNALGLLNLFERLRNLLFAHLSRILWTSFPAFAPGSLECVLLNTRWSHPSVTSPACRVRQVELPAHRFSEGFFRIMNRFVTNLLSPTPSC